MTRILRRCTCQDGMIECIYLTAVNFFITFKSLTFGMWAFNLFFCLSSTNIRELARRHVKTGAMHLAVDMEGMFAAEKEAVKCKEGNPPFRVSALNPLSATY